MNLLQIDSSILGDRSVSRTVSTEIVYRLVGADPRPKLRIETSRRTPLSHFSGAYLAGKWADVQHDQALQDDLALGAALSRSSWRPILL